MCSCNFCQLYDLPQQWLVGALRHSFVAKLFVSHRSKLPAQHGIWIWCENCGQKCNQTCRGTLYVAASSCKVGLIDGNKTSSLAKKDPSIWSNTFPRCYNIDVGPKDKFLGRLLKHQICQYLVWKTPSVSWCWFSQTASKTLLFVYLNTVSTVQKANRNLCLKNTCIRVQNQLQAKYDSTKTFRP